MSDANSKNWVLTFGIVARLRGKVALINGPRYAETRRTRVSLLDF